MILVDFSPVVISAVTAAAFSTKNPIDIHQIDEVLIRNMVLNMLRSYKSKFSREYGELVICVDSSNAWRKSFFPEYKENRKAARENGAIDWNFVFTCMGKILEDIKTYFPYPVVKVERTEADDIIGVLAEWSQTNDLIQTFMSSPKPLLIISGDGDFIQLQKFRNVKQYGPTQKDFITLPDGYSAKSFLMEHIATGDDKDGVPNTLSPDRSFVDKIRQKSLRVERKSEFIKLGKDACKTDDEQRYWDRNELMIDLSKVPAEYKDAIISEFEAELNRSRLTGRRRILTYLVKNKCAGLMEYVNDF